MEALGEVDVEVPRRVVQLGGLSKDVPFDVGAKASRQNKLSVYVLG